MKKPWACIYTRKSEAKTVELPKIMSFPSTMDNYRHESESRAFTLMAKSIGIVWEA